jgi:N-acetylneuraminate synthase
MKKRVFKRPKVIAEIGCNHKGDFDIAKELIRIAKDCGASVAKFQKRNPKTLLSEQQYNSPHLFPHNSYGSSYGEHRDFLEFSQEQHSELKKYCESKSIIYATSVWDVVSAKEIVELNPLYIKVPSAQNTNFKLLQILRDDYKGDVHVSLGMTSRKEEGELVEFFQKNWRCKGSFDTI